MTAGNTLEQLLIEARVLSPMQMAIARRDADEHRGKLAPSLIDLGLIPEERLASWIAETSGLLLLHPLPDDEVAALLDRIPAALALEHEVLAIGLDGDELTIAMADPFDRSAIESVHAATGMKIRTVVARQSEISRLLVRSHPETAKPEPAPFDFGSETLMLSQRQPLAIGDDSPGSRTHIFTPRPELLEPTQLDRIEAQLAQLTRSVEALERKLSAIDLALARVVSR